MWGFGKVISGVSAVRNVVVQGSDSLKCTSAGLIKGGRVSVRQGDRGLDYRYTAIYTIYYACTVFKVWLLLGIHIACVVNSYIYKILQIKDAHQIALRKMHLVEIFDWDYIKYPRRLLKRKINLDNNQCL